MYPFCRNDSVAYEYVLFLYHLLLYNLTRGFYLVGEESVPKHARIYPSDHFSVFRLCIGFLMTTICTTVCGFYHLFFLGHRVIALRRSDGEDIIR